MSEAVAVTSPPAVRRVNATIAGSRVSVRLDADGFATRVDRVVRLEYGPDLYAACKGAPGPTEKVVPYQPGYMRLVAGMGGQLVCPSTVVDPEAGNVRPNPLVETYAGTGIVKRVTATAICAVRHPQTMEWCVSTGTSVQDAEGSLRQTLAKIEREDCVKFLSAEDIEAERTEGSFRGWAAIPYGVETLGGQLYLCCNMAKSSVREAFQTFQNLALTIRQRAMSKAERLAADHNPLTRMVMEYGSLKFPRDEKGDLIGAPYCDVPVVAWVEHRERKALEGWIRSLADLGRADAVDHVIAAPPVVETEGEAIDGEEEETAPATLAAPVERESIASILEQARSVPEPEPVLVQEAHREREVATAPPPLQAKVEEPLPSQPTQGGAWAKASDRVRELIGDIEELIPGIAPASVANMASAMGTVPEKLVAAELASWTDARLQTLLSKLSRAAGRG